MDVIYRGIIDRSPWFMMFTDDIVVRRHVVEEQLEQCRVILEVRGLNISRKKTEYLSFSEDQDYNIRMQEIKLDGI